MLGAEVERNKATIRRLVDAHNRQDAKAAAACFALVATNHGHAADPPAMECLYNNLYRTFPDYHWQIEGLFGEDDRIALKVTQSGTHLGTPDLPVFGGLIHGVPPTGKRVSVLNIHLYQMADGLIAHHSAVRDDLGMMQQLGLLPQTRHEAGDVSRPVR